MNTEQIKNSIDTDWPVEARFLLTKTTEEIEHTIVELSHTWRGLHNFENKPWWKKIGKRKRAMRLAKEGLDQILFEYNRNEKETEN